MAEFQPAFDFMAPHEWNRMKHLTDIPGDPGGLTNYGITLATLQTTGTLYDLDHDGVITGKDLTMLTPEGAQSIYLARYWEPVGWAQLLAQSVASKCFDMGVNLGTARAVMYLQEVANEFGCGLLVDGRFGPKTAQLVNGLDPGRVLDGLVHVLSDHYTTWVQGHPDRQKFLDGLLNRARSLP